MMMQGKEFSNEVECNCCFCGKRIRMDQSNNPSPVCVLPEARCCGDCNQSIVIPFRNHLSKAVPELDKEKSDKDMKEAADLIKEYAKIYNAVQEADDLFDKADGDAVSLATIRDHMAAYLENHPYPSETEYRSFFEVIMISLNKVIDDLLEDLGDGFEQWRLKLKAAGVRK